jgi:hypothetical protein
MRAIVCLLVLVCGCAGLPKIVPTRAPEERDAITNACLAAFPEGHWAASHSIDASLPFGHNALLIGVASARRDGMHYVLLSPEGFALFDASVVQGGLRVSRALPPFDRPGFADGLVGDVNSTFRAPAGAPRVVGRDESGAGVCRWQSGDDTTDVEVSGAVPKRIKSFHGSDLVREVVLSGAPDGGFYPDLLLRVPGMAGYTLDMHLISHEADTGEAGGPR